MRRTRRADGTIVNRVDQSGLRPAAAAGAPASDPRPLVVALENGLIANTLEEERAWARRSGWSTRLFRDEPEFDPALPATALPFTASVLDMIRDARDEGTEVYLAAFGELETGQAVAAHLGFFDGVVDSGSALNRPYLFLGTPRDTDLWQRASHVVTVDADPGLRHAADRHPGGATHTGRAGSRGQEMLRALRPHQWLKNLLVFVPVIAGQQLDALTWLYAVLAFIAFSATASSVYVLNDLLDLAADRAHPRKCLRPFAAGSLPIRFGRGMIVALLALGTTIAAFAGPAFLAVLATYYVITLAYSLGSRNAR